MLEGNLESAKARPWPHAAATLYRCLPWFRAWPFLLRHRSQRKIIPMPRASASRTAGRFYQNIISSELQQAHPRGHFIDSTRSASMNRLLERCLWNLEPAKAQAMNSRYWYFLQVGLRENNLPFGLFFRTAPTKLQFPSAYVKSRHISMFVAKSVLRSESLPHYSLCSSCSAVTLN